MSTAWRVASTFLLIVAVTAGTARAQQPGRSTAATAVSIAKFLGGAAMGFGLHESGHLVLDVAFDAAPGVRRVSAGFIPFFAITHGPVSPVREFAISSAGFWVQHGTSEWLLTRRPHLKDEHAPIAKGLLAFNVLTSLGYAGAAFARRGPLERDTRGLALSARIAEPWAGVAILAPALLDAGRYYQPENRWLRWASRGSKVAAAMLIVRAASD